MSNTDAPATELLTTTTSERQKLLAFIRKRSRNPNETEDIYQETMERITRRLSAGEKPQDLIGYIYRIAMNIINDDYRKASVHDAPEPLTEDLVCPHPQPDQRLESHHQLQIFMDCLKQLPAETRTIIIMRKLHGKSNAQIGREIGLSDKAVEKKLNRALHAIEERISRGQAVRSPRRFLSWGAE